jgi:DDE family transposase
MSMIALLYGAWSKGCVASCLGIAATSPLPLSQLLFEQGLQLITRLRKNMKKHLMHLSDKLLLRKRAIIESTIDQLKNSSQIEHSRHRRPTNFVVHLIAGLLAYNH